MNDICADENNDSDVYSRCSYTYRKRQIQLHTEVDEDTEMDSGSDVDEGECRDALIYSAEERGSEGSLTRGPQLWDSLSNNSIYEN